MVVEDSPPEVRNLAIIAHVDHGKTTLADAMMVQCDLFREHGIDAPDLMNSMPRDREKSITVMPRNTSLLFKDVRINILDTPGHANFGSEVQRTLRIVDGFMLVVDAGEGPLPKTRFVLSKAIEAGLAPIVVINKIDRPGARPEEVLQEVREMFTDLDASERQQQFPVLYCNSLRGICRRSPDGEDELLIPLFEAILEKVPHPETDPGSGLQMLVTDLDYDDYLGRLALGKIYNGSVRPDLEVAHCRIDGRTVQGKISGLYGCEGLRRTEIDLAGPGSIVSVTGVEGVSIGDTLASPDGPDPLPPVRVDEPTLSMVLAVNDSPTAGLDGTFVSAGDLRERIWREILTNVSIRVEETGSPNAFRISGRGELQLVILMEMMRREGYEMLVSRPEIVTRENDGRLREPMETLLIDCPEEHVAVVTGKLEVRKGKMTSMTNHGRGRVRMEFLVPSRGLLGYRTEFLSDTRGTGILNHMFDSYDDWCGDIPCRNTGSLVADRPGRATAYAIEHLQSRGTIFVAPGDQVYEGMLVGENPKANDVEVNITKERKSLPTAAVPGTDVVRLIPPRSMSLEHALEFIREDELVEVTPRALRLRKRQLLGSRRSGGQV